jgi:hypothetical protein
MLYPIWKPLPRPRHFPEDPRLDRLLADYSLRVGYFKLRMKRRHARDLRKGLFGPQGVLDVPRGRGVRTFELPKGWTLRLTYYETAWAGDVDAEFIPPAMRVEPFIPLRGGRRSAEEATLDDRSLEPGSSHGNVAVPYR